MPGRFVVLPPSNQCGYWKKSGKKRKNYLGIYHRRALDRDRLAALSPGGFGKPPHSQCETVYVPLWIGHPDNAHAIW